MVRQPSSEETVQMKNLTSPVVIKEINSDLTVTFYGETSSNHDDGTPCMSSLSDCMLRVESGTAELVTSPLLKINMLDFLYSPQALEKMKAWDDAILKAAHALEEMRQATLDTPYEDFLVDLLGQSVGSVSDALADVSSALYARVSDNDVSYSREKSNG